jgi:flavin-dependent thymidylate synthase
MKIIKPAVLIEDNLEVLGHDYVKMIERFTRKCYKSEEKITDTSYLDFVKRVYQTKKHEGIIEHRFASVTVVTDRGCCYDKETEVLTKDGWKKFENITPNDFFACLNDNNYLEYYKPSNVQKYKFNGNLLRFESTKIDLLVTPNHNMWIFDNGKTSIKNKIWKFIRADDLTIKHFNLYKTANWEGKDVDIIIPKHPTKYKQFPEIKIKQDRVGDFFEFLGIWVTDGHYNKNIGTKGSSLGISQSKKRGVKRIKYLCERLGFKYNYKKNRNSFNIDNLRLLLYVESLFGVGPKTFSLKIPIFIKESKQEYIKRFLDGVILGDGNIHKKNKHIVIYTSSNNFTGDLQELFLKIGLSANIRTIKPRKRRFILGIPVKSSQISYIVSVCKKPIAYLSKKRSKNFASLIKYNDYVYCATVPYHRLYVRRNGKSVWCGNSHEFVRHRMASYLQESTRYCDYSSDGKHKGVTFILPPWCELSGGEDIDIRQRRENYDFLFYRLESAEFHYQNALKFGWKPEEARGFLPHFTKTEFTVTMNLGSWMNFFKKRTVASAHPQMRQIAVPILKEFKKNIPIIFDELEIPELPYEEAKVIKSLDEIEIVYENKNV